MSKTVRIGAASAFITDSVSAVGQLLRAEPCPKYLMFDFMAEGTIGMMSRSVRADAKGGGYVPDIVTTHIAPNLHDIVTKGVKLIANAGGMNPKGCAEAIEAFLQERGVNLKVAYVEGDNILPQAAALAGAGVKEMFSGAAFPENVSSLNVYLGGFPIAKALDEGADIVITGRCADSALGLGALIHEFGWKQDDWNKLAAGTLVGHLLECGCQVTGGTFTDWEDVPGWENVGFPIADVTEDGACVISKPAGTGGLVSVGSVAEQLLYEVSDPQAYIVADVICDFSEVKLVQAGENQVSVSGVRGYPATDTYKGVASYDAGFRGTYAQIIIGMDAVRKAERQGEALIQRGKALLRGRNLGDYIRTDVDVVGAETSYGPRGKASHVREVFMRASVDHAEKSGAEIFCREAISAITAMAPGSTATLNVTVAPLSRLFLFLVPKQASRSRRQWVKRFGKCNRMPDKNSAPASLHRPPVAVPAGTEAMTTVPLIRLAWGRSGDKGNLFNIAVIARQARYLPYIRAALTQEAIGAWFAFLYAPGTEPRVDAYDVPGFHAVNYVVHDSLDGGISMSPRIDTAAKGMAQQLLEFPVPVPTKFL